MPSSSTASLLDALRQYHLLDSRQLDELAANQAPCAEPKAIAGELLAPLRPWSVQIGAQEGQLG